MATDVSYFEVEGDPTLYQFNDPDAESALAALNQRLQTAEGNISTLQVDVTTLDGSVTDVQGDVATLQGDVSTAQGDILDLQSDIDDLQFESGSGYCRMPDGTQICWKSVVFSNISITKAWGNSYESTEPLDFGNWPIAFIDVPVVSITTTSTAMTIESLRQTTATSIGNGYVYRPTSGTFNSSFSVIGIGRWK